MGYLLEIAGIDRTTDSDLTNYQFKSSTSDRIPEVDLHLIDADPDHRYDIMDEIIVVDTGASSQPNPTINLVVNPTMDQGTQGLGSYAQIPLTDATIAGGPLHMTLNNASYNSSGSDQTLGLNFAGIAQTIYITRGQTYALSATCRVINASPLVGASVCLMISFFPAGGIPNSGHLTYQTFTPSTTSQRFSIQYAASPSDAYAYIEVGVLVQAATNSGQVLFESLQFESNTFVAEGISYPTPDCNHLVPGCIVLPDGTTCRQTRIFTGFICSIDPDPDQIIIPCGNDPFMPETDPRPIVAVGCRGTAHLLETKHVNAVLSGQDSDLIINTVTQLLPNQIDTSGVLDGITVDGLTSDDNTILELIQNFADISGYIFYVDHYYRLKYEPFGYSSAAFALSDMPDYIYTFPYQNWKNSIDGTQIGNRVTVHGGAYNGTAEENYSASDATTGANGYKRITLSKTVSVHGVLSVKVNGTEQTKGVYGNNRTTFAGGYQCLTDIPNNQLVFQSIPGGATIYCQYSFSGNIREQVVDIQSVAHFKRRNFDGFFDRKVHDTNLTTSDAALRRGITELGQYAYGQPNPSLTCLYPLVAGQTVQITSAQDGYTSKPLLIQEVTTKLLGSGIVEYSVQLGADIPTITRSFKRLHKSKQRTSRYSADPLTSINLIARESLTYLPDLIQVQAQTKLCWNYGDPDAIYGYSSYCMAAPPPASGTYHYGDANALYGTAIYQS